MNPIYRTVVVAIVAILASACAGRGAPAPGAPTPALEPAPWTGAPIAPGEAPPPYLDEWRVAENAPTCALLAVPTGMEGAAGAEAVARAATFSGGWAVAYDLPGLRSAFGVAGTGSSASDATYDAWPYSREWADGSSAGYGPEGGTGPNLLAYLRVAGQDCLYNVWSRVSVQHLEHLLESLRFVRTAH